jgi:hypothetical protein
VTANKRLSGNLQANETKIPADNRKTFASRELKMRVKLKEFGEYIQDKSVSQLLHRARKESLKRILAHEDMLQAPRKNPAQKRTGTR